jgi:cytochrome c biogenesis protein CcmG/thiol:disulfide interchange protein DsbE
MSLYRFLFVLPLVVFAALSLYFTAGLSRDPHAIPSVLIDKPAPPFELPPLPGQAPGLATADLRGTPLLLNVFASWCAPCRLEHPLLVRLAGELRIPVYGINYKDKPEDALAWLKALGNPYRAIGADRDGRVGIEFGVYGVPETFVIDREGRIRYKHVGPLTAETVEGVLLPLLKKLGS